MSVEVLRDLADERIYRRNAFHVSGLPTTAGTRDIRERRKRVHAAVAIGADLPASSAGNGFVVDASPGPDELTAAFEVLGDARRRIVHELLWVWGEDTAACGCAPADHRRHDEAVRRHARVLDAALAGHHDRQGWEAAARRWKEVIGRAGTWRHLHARVGDLDERRLVDAVVDDLRAELPRTLVASVVAAALRHDEPFVPVLRGWGAGPGESEDVVLDATAPLVTTIDTRLDEAARVLEEERPRDAAAEVRSSVLPVLRRLAAVAPAERFRHTADAADRVAIVLNNCALALADADRADDRTVVLDLYDEATSVGPRSDTLATVQANRSAYEDRARVDRVLAPFGLRVVDDGVQKLFDAFLVAVRRRDDPFALAACRALLQVSDDPEVTAQLKYSEAQLRLLGAQPRPRSVSGGRRRPTAPGPRYGADRGRPQRSPVVTVVIWVFLVVAVIAAFTVEPLFGLGALAIALIVAAFVSEMRR